jgi:uroporphyrinogen-III decarboxylase
LLKPDFALLNPTYNELPERCILDGSVLSGGVMAQSIGQSRQLTWEEKRAARFQRWLSPPGVKFDSPAAQSGYRERVNRFIRAITLEPTDRVPVVLPLANYPAYYCGHTLHDIMYDYDILRRVWLKFMDDFELDTYAAPVMVTPGRVMEALGSRNRKWPGHGLSPDTSMYQYVEGEYMKADEYDAYLEDHLEYILRGYLPRAHDVFKPFQELDTHYTVFDLPNKILALCARPDFRAAFKVLSEASEEYMRWWQVVKDIQTRILAAGIPSFRGVMAEAPFDHYGDTFRGTKGIFSDVYRQPDVLLHAMEAYIPRTIKRITASADVMHSPLVFMPLHKGDDTFMSEKQFLTYYWPQLKQLLLEMIGEGLVPYLFAEGKYNNRLELINELPRGSVIWHFDQTDMIRAKQILGSNVCLTGNVPASLICTGTAAAVKARCVELIQVCGTGSGYILAGGASIDKCHPDNLRAMTEAAHECGST